MIHICKFLLGLSHEKKFSKNLNLRASSRVQKTYDGALAVLAPISLLSVWYYQVSRNTEAATGKQFYEPRFTYQFCEKFFCKIFPSFRVLASLVQIHHGSGKTFQFLKRWKKNSQDCNRHHQNITTIRKPFLRRSLSIKCI